MTGPRPAVPLAASTERMTVVGIDPASTAGLVALSVYRDRPGYEDAWRWLSHDVISESSSKFRGKTENKLVRLFDEARAWITRHAPDYVVLERPADMEVRKFAQTGQGQGGRPNMAGTSFAIGEAFGMLAAAGYDASSTGTTHAYAATSRQASATKAERVGWMPNVRTGRFVHVMKRETLLYQLSARAYEIRNRAHLGKTFARPNERLDDNVLMAFGVLTFHLSRQTR